MLRLLLLLTVALLAYTAQCDATCSGALLHFHGRMISTGCKPEGSELSGNRVCFDISGSDGGRIELDGNTLIKVPFMSSYLSENPVSQFSVSLWARQPSGASSSGLVGNSGCGDSTFGITGSTTESISSFVVIGYGATIFQTLTASTTIKLSANEWTHLALTYNGTTLRTYVNGEEEAVDRRNGGGSPPQPIFSNSCPMTIGQAGAETDVQFFEGDLKNVAVFDRTLTDGEVQAMEQKNFNY